MSGTGHGLAPRRPVDAVLIDVAVADEVLEVALDRFLRLADEVDLHQRFNVKAFAELKKRIEVVNFGGPPIRVFPDVILPVEVGPRAAMVVTVEDESAGIPRDSQARFADIAEHLLWILWVPQRIGLVIDPRTEDVGTDPALMHTRANRYLDGQSLLPRPC